MGKFDHTRLSKSARFGLDLLTLRSSRPFITALMGWGSELVVYSESICHAPTASNKQCGIRLVQTVRFSRFQLAKARS